MNICLFCGKTTLNPKFCNSSCAASYNNSIYPKRTKKQYFCIACGIVLHTVTKYCNTCINIKNNNLITLWYEELEPLISLGYSSRKIASKLNISQTAVRNRLKKCNLKLKTSHNAKENICQYCSKELINNQSKFCSLEHKQLYYVSNDYYEKRYSKGKHERNKLLEQLGNKCSICGYNKNSAALVFHHTNPKEKDFCISIKNCIFKKEDELQQEIKKCVLLCSNCHAELHYPSYNIFGSGEI